MIVSGIFQGREPVAPANFCGAKCPWSRVPSTPMFWRDSFADRDPAR
jgi:hypothetical protein